MAHWSYRLIVTAISQLTASLISFIRRRHPHSANVCHQAVAANWVICKQYIKHGYYFSGPNVLHIQWTLTQLQLSTNVVWPILCYDVRSILTYSYTYSRFHLLHAVRCVMLALKLMKWLTAVPRLRAKCYSSQSIFH